MKKFVAFVVILSLGLFTVGCGNPAPKTVEKAKAPAAGAAAGEKKADEAKPAADAKAPAAGEKKADEAKPAADAKPAEGEKK